MKALISKNEDVLNPNTQEVLGKRVAEVVETEFEVNPTNLMWVDCDASVDKNTYYYNDGVFALIPAELPKVPTWEDNRDFAIYQLAKDRDYEMLINADGSALLNKDHIVAYYNQNVDRKENPQAGNLEWLVWEEPNWA